jgi:hypothetical protein
VNRAARQLNTGDRPMVPALGWPRTVTLVVI